MNNNDSKRKIISLLLVAAAVVIIILMIVIATKGKKSTVDVDQGTTGNTEQTVQENKDDVNYVQNEDGSKVNTSTEVSETKVVDNVTIEKSTVVFENGMTKLTSKVTNGGSDATDLKYKVLFKDADGNVIKESTGLVGDIKAGQVKYIISYVTGDASNAKSITYEKITQ